MRRAGLPLLAVSLFAVVGCLHLETQRRLEAQRQQQAVEREILLQPRTSSSGLSSLSGVPAGLPSAQRRDEQERRSTPVRLEPAAPQQRGDGGCSPHDSGCIMAQLRSQLSFTGVGDGGCTSTDRDCKEEYSRWLSSSSANVGATPSGIHLTFAEPQHDSAAPSLFDDDALVLSWTTTSDVPGGCSMARLRPWTQAGGSDYQKRSTSPGSARYSAGVSRSVTALALLARLYSALAAVYFLAALTDRRRHHRAQREARWSSTGYMVSLPSRLCCTRME